MSQVIFNRIITMTMLLFFMGMYAYSFITGRPLDVAGLLAFTVPTTNHIVHQITQSQLVLKGIDSTTQTAVAKIVANGKAESDVHP